MSGTENKLKTIINLADLDYQCFKCGTKFPLRPRKCYHCVKYSSLPQKQKDKLECLCNECYTRHNHKYHPEKLEGARCKPDDEHICDRCILDFEKKGIDYRKCYWRNSVEQTD